MSSEPSPRFTGIFIPVEILERKDISIFEKLLLSWIDSLFDIGRSGCFASNKYLADKLGVKENTVAKAITHLRKQGLIEDVSFNGRDRVMRALINKSVHESQSKSGLDKNPSRVGQKSKATLDKNPSPPYIYSKGDSKEREGSASPPLPPPLSSKKIERSENVSTTQDEHEKLQSSHGEEKTQTLYERLSLWKNDTPKSKWKKSDYLAITRWVVDAVNDDALKDEKRNKVSNDEDNIAYSKKLEENYNLVRGPQISVRIEAQPTQIIIYSTHPTSLVKPYVLKYKENGFREQIDQALRKWKLI